MTGVYIVGPLAAAGSGMDAARAVRSGDSAHANRAGSSADFVGSQSGLGCGATARGLHRGNAPTHTRPATR